MENSNPEKLPPTNTPVVVDTAEELKKIVEENQALMIEVRSLLHQVRNYLFWQRVISAIYLFLIVAPIIFAILYLPSLVKPYLSQYQAILNEADGSKSTGSESLLRLLQQFQKQPPTATPQR